MLELGNQKLLIVAPHPDDEVLGCGGLIHRIKEAGGQVYVLFITVGTTRDFSEQGISTYQERLNETEEVARFLKYDGYHHAFPGDGYHLHLDQLPQWQMINEIERGSIISLETTRPTILAIPEINDFNQDHRAVGQAAAAALRPAPLENKYLPRLTLGYRSVPTADWMSASSANPNYFVELNQAALDSQVTALSLYVSQIRTNGHLRTPEALVDRARSWGRWSGFQYAEPYWNRRATLSL